MLMIVGFKMRISSLSPPIGGQIWDWMCVEEIASQSLPVTVVNVYDVLDFRGWGVGGRLTQMANPRSSGSDLSLIRPLTYWSNYASVALN